MVQPGKKLPGLVIHASRKRLDAPAPYPASDAHGYHFPAGIMRRTLEVYHRNRYLQRRRLAVILAEMPLPLTLVVYRMVLVLVRAQPFHHPREIFPVDSIRCRACDR